MSQRFLKLRVTVASGSSYAFSSGSTMSKLLPAIGVQLKSLPDPDHHRWLGLAPSPLLNTSSSSTCRAGSLATYIWELWTGPSSPWVNVYGVPSGRCQVIEPMSTFESGMLVSVRLLSSTSGTTQP